MRTSEETPLLWHLDDYYGSPSRNTIPTNQHCQLTHKDVSGNSPHAQFCALVGCPPSNANAEQKFSVPKKSLYGRTVSQLSSQRRAYNASAALNNGLLLSQVILGAALTGLGASSSSHILITVFGALNTVIAGIVAYLKSRGQPMRARMYRDDLERIVDEIENSEVMWRGISEGVHGYDEIDTDEVTVRSEVARLTRLYERAIRLNGMNNPDMYMAGTGGFDGNMQGRPRHYRGDPGFVPAGALPGVTAPAALQPSGDNSGPTVHLVGNPDDVAPATRADVSDKKQEEQNRESKGEGKKPSTDGTSDINDTKPAEPSSSKSFIDAKPDPSPKPDSAQPAQPAQPPQPPAPAPPTVTTPAPAKDPDASPATAARLKPKRAKSKPPDGDGVGGESQKVAGDEDS